MFSNLRVGGLATGIDTETIIQDLMRVHRMPLQRLEQSRQILEWQQEDYREINTALRSFRDIVFNMKLQSTYLAKSATSSNEAAVTAGANVNSTPGSYAVTVHQLAEGISKGSQNPLDDEKNDDGTTKTLAEQFGLSGTVTFELTGSKGTESFSFDTGAKTIYDVVSEINKADLGIKASYDFNLDRFFMASEATGENQVIIVSNDTSNFLSDGVGDGSGNALALQIQTGTEYKGQDAKIDFGDVIGLASSTNSITVNGITLDLRAGGSGRVTVSNNTEAVFDSIVGFVDQYNSVIETITNKYYEERYHDYPPLTEEQREQLTDSQIEKWEEKAQSGLLRRDPLLSGILSRMRSTMSTVVSDIGGSFNTLSRIGITTTGDYMNPRLVVDENKLREALQNDAEGVMELFTKSSEEYEDMGIAQRLYEDTNFGMERLIEKAGSASSLTLVDNSFIGKEISEIDEQLETWQDRLLQIENRYWNQFTAMEKAIQQMNAQSAWLMQQFGGYGQ